MRRIISAIVALAITMVLPLVAPQTAQAASKKTKVSISVSTTKLSQGKYLTIKGKVKPAVAGRTVVLQHKMDGAGWKNEVTLATAADGSYTSTGQVNKLQNRYYRVYAPKFKKYKKAYSKAIYVKVTAPVQQAASVAITSTGSTTLTAGANFVVNGTASANLVGKTVVLTLNGSSGWSDLGSATVAADSTFSLSAPATLAGAGQLVKVYAPATSTTYYAESGTATFNVYGWYYLSERSVVEGDIDKSAATINGQYYGKSLYEAFYSTSGPYSGQFDLGRKCTTFAATIGWKDSSDSSSAGVATIYKDSVTAWTKQGIAFGSAVPVSIDISGALRLKVEAQRSSKGYVYSYLAFGDARILCAF